MFRRQEQLERQGGEAASAVQAEIGRRSWLLVVFSGGFWAEAV